MMQPFPVCPVVFRLRALYRAVPQGQRHMKGRN
jgi:hypothetical protein